MLKTVATYIPPKRRFNFNKLYGVIFEKSEQFAPTPLNAWNPERWNFKLVILKSYKIITLPVVLYGCETWSLTLREEHRLRVFENRLLRRIFGPKRDDVTGDLRKLHNEELHNFYSSPNIIRMMKSRRIRWAGHLARMGGDEDCV
jgi:hypothetical protein